MNKNTVFNIVSTVVVALAHVFMIVAIMLAYRYFAIYPSLIGSIVGIVLCVVIIVDIVFFVGLGYKDMAMKIVSLVLASFIFLGSAFGAYYVNKVNKTIGSVIDTGNNSSSSGNDKVMETVNGVFAVRGEDSSEYVGLKSFSGKKIGYVAETTEGVATVGQQMLKDENIDFAAVEYNTNDEMVTDLYDGKIDAIIILDGYKSLYSKMAESGGADLSGVVSTFYDVQTFEKEVEVTNTGTSVDISTDPFNILLIGYSRTEIGSPIGLADAIIVASVNPKTYTVSMMSIARDSYVPISCYGGTKDKINSARGTSRACFIETVESYTGMKMDFYMEADYEAVVAVVDALEGIVINNPVDFVLDGIEVPAGTYTAWGWQVLQFCRERHHMPNGDFDRQQHQKEVIIAIAEKLIKKADITLFLNAIEAAGDKFSTNLTLNQLTGMFNMILNTKNYTGLKVSSLIDFQQLRLTGYASWYYNYSMHLPLWIYKIYDGSYEEAMGHAHAVLGDNVDTSGQVYEFAFDVNLPYERPQLYQNYYDEPHEDEKMPAYYPNLTGMTYADVMAWASNNRITLDVRFITKDDPGYNEGSDGYVVSQSPRYGMLLSEYPTCTITVMGDGTNNKVRDLLDYTGMLYTEVVQWAEDRGYRYALRQTYVTADELDEEDNNKVWKVDIDEDEEGDILKIRYYTICNGTVTDNVCSVQCQHTWDSGTVTKEATCDAKGVKTYKCTKCGATKTEDIPVKTDGCTVTCSHTWDGGTVTKEATCTEKGTITYKCTKCGQTKNEDIPVKVDGCTVECSHTWDEGEITTQPTCTGAGVKTYTCTKCGVTKTETVPATGHTEEDVAEVPATCTSKGRAAGKKCSKCGAILSGCGEIATIDHTSSNVDEEPATCTAAGHTAGTICSVCGTVLSGLDVLPQLTDCPVDSNSSGQ